MTTTELPTPRPARKGGPLRFAIRVILSLFVGMKVTLRELAFGKLVTIKYPMEKPELTGAFRSAIKLVTFEDLDGTHDCIACDACELICPSYCIEVKGDRIGDSKKKRANVFLVDFSTCSLCGLCIAVCPTETLGYSRHYDDAGYDSKWTHDLLEPFEEPPADTLLGLLTARDEAKRAARKAAREAKAKAKAAPAKAAAAKPPAAKPAAPAKPEAGDA